MSGEHESILILDFGSQYTQLIARRVRELNVFSEILPCDAGLERIRRPGLKGIVLSGGPQSVYDENAPSMDTEIYNLGVPVLGICYGLQLMMRDLGGEITAADSAEYGPASVEIEDPHSPLFIGLDARQFVWASHGDHISKPAPGFVRTASSRNAPFSALEDRAKKTAPAMG